MKRRNYRSLGSPEIHPYSQQVKPCKPQPPKKLYLRVTFASKHPWPTARERKTVSAGNANALETAKKSDCQQNADSTCELFESPIPTAGDWVEQAIWTIPSWTWVACGHAHAQKCAYSHALIPLHGRSPHAPPAGLRSGKDFARRVLCAGKKRSERTKKVVLPVGTLRKIAAVVV